MSSKICQGTATAEEFSYYPDSGEPDRRRFVDQQNRQSWHRNIFQMAIERDCCAKERLGKRSDGSGSCFLAKIDVNGVLQLNTDPLSPLVYLLTSAHNLYCRKHAKYAESIDLVRMKPGQHTQGKNSLLKQPVTNTCGPSDSGRRSFFRVPKFYENCDGDHLAQTIDFGIICVARDLFRDPQAELVVVDSIGLNLQGPVKPEYRQASVCGFPMYIIRNHGTPIDIPQSECQSEIPSDEIVWVKGRSKTVDRFCVIGALYEMPAPPLTSLAANSSMQERRVAECRSAGLFAFPQNHFNELTQEIVYRTDDQCRQRLFRHYITTSGGQSGSPVYIVNDVDNATVVGIHIGIWLYTANGGKAEFNEDTDCNIAIRLTDHMLKEVFFLTRQEPAVAVESGEAQSLPHPNNARPYAHEDQMKWASYRAQLPNAAAAAGSASDGKTQPPSAGTAGTPAPSDSAEAAPVRPPPSGAADGTGQLLVQKGGAGGKPFPCGGTDSTGPATAEVALAEARIVASGSGQGSVKVSSQDPNSGYAANPRAEQQIESTPRPRHQPAPAPRTVHQQPPDNPWDSHDFLESYDWLVENLAPVKLRTSVRKYILQHQLSKLKNAGDSDTVHNESVFLFIRAHGWTSYRHFLKVLSRWPVARAQEIASDLQKAAGPST